MFDIVLVWKLDRFSRDRYDSARYKAQLKKNNVKVISATEKIEEGSAGILLESVLEGMAEYYSADLSEKVIRGLTENALKCKYNGSSIPIGFMVDKEQKFQVDPLTAPLVLEAFTTYKGGKTIKEIVDYFNVKGIKTGKGKAISIDVITKMLSNRRYLGEYAYRDVVVPNGMPAIVSEELFTAVQERRAKNKKLLPAKRQKMIIC